MAERSFEKIEQLALPIDTNGCDAHTMQTNNLEERVTLLILRDLLRLNWSVNYLENKIEVIPPECYDKKVIKDSMAVKRNEILMAKRKKFACIEKVRPDHLALEEKKYLKFIET